MKIDLYGHETADFYGLYEHFMNRLFPKYIGII